MAANNPNVNYSSTPLIGIGLNRRTNTTTETNPIEHALGTIVTDNTGRVWVYVRAPAIILAQAIVTVTWGTVDAASIGSKTLNNWQNGSQAFAAGDYGWVQSIRHLGTVPPAAYTGSGS